MGKVKEMLPQLLCFLGLVFILVGIVSLLGRCGSDAIFVEPEDLNIVSVESIPDSAEHQSFLAEVEYDGVVYDVTVPSKDVCVSRIYKSNNSLNYMGDMHYYAICVAVAIGSVLLFVGIAFLYLEEVRGSR